MLAAAWELLQAEVVQQRKLGQIRVLLHTLALDVFQLRAER